MPQSNDLLAGDLCSSHCVIFDLDGTLVDTAPDLCRALNFVLEREKLPGVAVERIRAYVGQGAKGLLRQALTFLDRTVAEDTLTQWTEDLVDYYQQHIADLSIPFEGVVPALDRLTAAGVKLGVCTNKREGLSRLLLEELNLDRYFPVVVGADTLAVRKPDPMHLLETISRLKAEPGASVMIGDSETDIKTARAARVASIAVNFGYSLVPVERLDPDFVIGHFNDLERILLEAFSDRPR